MDGGKEGGVGGWEDDREDERRNKQMERSVLGRLGGWKLG